MSNFITKLSDSNPTSDDSHLSLVDCQGGLWEEIYVGNFKTFWEAPDLIRRQEIHPFLMLQQGTQ